MKHFIGVIGAGHCDTKTYEIAYLTGAEIAKNKFGMVCGGLGGVMEAAARGCKENGGLTLGIIPDADAGQANEYIDIVIPTGMGIMRNLLIVRSAAGIIAINGKYGTLSEIAFALQLDKPLIGLQTWDVSDKIMTADSPQKAVKLLVSML